MSFFCLFRLISFEIRLWSSLQIEIYSNFLLLLITPRNESGIRKKYFK